jgi:hypothetical protein
MTSLVLRLLGLSLLGCAAATAAAPDGPGLPAFVKVRPFAIVLESAARAGMPVQAYPTSRGGNTLNPGDAFMSVASLREGSDETQWLICAEVAASKENELSKTDPGTLRFHTILGTDLVIDSTRVPLELRVIGPFVNNRDRSRHYTARVLVNAGFLSSGFDRMCAWSLRLERLVPPERKQGSFEYGAGLKPFPPELVEQKRKQVSELKLEMTTEDERSIVGSALALNEFFRLTAETPGLDQILRQTVDVPWWSILRKGGRVNLSIQPMHRSIERLVETPSALVTSETAVYSYPMAALINGTPALHVRLAVTAPTPPLLANAGILCIAAQQPSGKGPHLAIEVIGTRLKSSPDLEQ